MIDSDPDDSTPGETPGEDTYVPARLRDYEAAHGSNLMLADTATCDHGSTVCKTWRCIESWTVDWELLFDQTSLGRELETILDAGPPTSTATNAPASDPADDAERADSTAHNAAVREDTESGT